MKSLILSIGLLLISSNLFGVNIKICVFDECTGKPIPGWTVTLFDSGPKGFLHYSRDFVTGEDGCLEISWAQQGNVSISVKDGGSWDVNGKLNVNTSIIPISCVNVVENDDEGNETDQTTLKETDGCNDWIFTSNVVAECNNPGIDFCVPEGFDSGDYCYRTDIIDCRKDRIVASQCGVLDFNRLFDGLSGGKYTMQMYYGCCDEDPDSETPLCPETLQGPIERTISWKPAVDFGDVDFDWIAGAPIPGQATVETINNEDPADQGDSRLFTADHPFPFLGEFSVGIDLDLGQISGNATDIKVSLNKLVDCEEASGVEIYSDSWSSTGQVPSTILFNNLMQGYFLMAQDYIKGETCFEFCIEAGDGNCSVEKCETFRIADNCPFCLKSGEKEELDFKIAPNPVSNYLYLRANDESKSLTIIDITGKRFYSGVFIRNIDVSQWGSGFYFAQYFDEKGSKVLKFHKQ